jgi:hypothetical protein
MRVHRHAARPGAGPSDRSSATSSATSGRRRYGPRSGGSRRGRAVELTTPTEAPSRADGSATAPMSQGLTGAVDSTDFARVLAGRNPRTGGRLITAQGSGGAPPDPRGRKRDPVGPRWLCPLRDAGRRCGSGHDGARGRGVRQAAGSRLLARRDSPWQRSRTPSPGGVPCPV